jgi:hypothetical protein
MNLNYRKLKVLSRQLIFSILSKIEYLHYATVLLEKFLYFEKGLCCLFERSLTSIGVKFLLDDLLIYLTIHPHQI